MSTFFLSASSFILLLMMAAWVSYWSKKIKIPATASLVAVGMLMAFWAKHHFLPFIDDFELTPDLLFYAFLPILLFESAYQIRYSELMRNIRSISALSIVSLVLSAFFIAVVLRFVFWWIGIEIPFIVSLLFGALISSTDTAAALSIFKEIGVPRRLNLIFEWESLFNDGTAIALFLVVLSVLEVNSPAWPIPEHVNFYTESIGHFGYLFGSFFPFLNWFFSIALMIVFWILIGVAIGILFSKLIQNVRHDSYFEITLSLILAHAAFLSAELINHYILPVSGIIATVSAAMVLGNYGRYKISPKVEEVMEKYWGFFTFVTNSLVFILVGMMLVNLWVNWRPLILPILITIPIVIIARAVSVYSVFGFLNHLKKEEKVPRSWQHVLSWWALRGGLAVMMILLIPVWITHPDWHMSGVSIRDFLLSLTLGVVVFSIFVKTITIAPLIRHFRIDGLTAIEELEYIEWRILMAKAAIEKVEKIREWKYIDEEEVQNLTQKYKKILDQAKKDFFLLKKKQWNGFSNLLLQVITLHALWIEKFQLQNLYKNEEIPEVVFTKLIQRVESQIRRVKRWEPQIQEIKSIKDKQSIFETISMYITDHLERKIDPVKAQYLEIRATHIVIKRVIEALSDLSKIDFVNESSEFIKVIWLYEWFRDSASRERRAIFRTHRDYLRNISATMTERSLLGTEEEILEDLHLKEIISPKLYLKFQKTLMK